MWIHDTAEHLYSIDDQPSSKANVHELEPSVTSTACAWLMMQLTIALIYLHRYMYQYLLGDNRVRPSQKTKHLCFDLDPKLLLANDSSIISLHHIQLYPSGSSHFAYTNFVCYRLSPKSTNFKANKFCSSHRADQNVPHKPEFKRIHEPLLCKTLGSICQISKSSACNKLKLRSVTVVDGLFWPVMNQLSYKNYHYIHLSEFCNLRVCAEG